MNKLYNPEIKERFLTNQYENEQTQKTIRNLLYKAASAEELLGKDLYDFSQEEIGKVIMNTNPHNSQVARTTGRFITQYISWAINPPERLRKNKLNPLRGVPSSWYDQFIDKTKKVHFSKSEFFDEIVRNLDNSQDQLLLSLIWFGIGGEKFVELKEMHYNHIHWNENKIDIYDDNGYNRTVTFDGEDVFVMHYLQRAYEDNIYRTLKEDGDYKETEILRSDYVFRNVKSARARSGEPLSFNVFYTRLKAIREALSLEYLTPNSISQSVQIYYAVQLIKRDGEFGLKQRNELGDKFNLPTVTNNNNKEYYNPAMISFINPKNIKMLYDLDVTM